MNLIWIMCEKIYYPIIIFFYLKKINKLKQKESADERKKDIY